MFTLQSHGSHMTLIHVPFSVQFGASGIESPQDHNDTIGISGFMKLHAFI